MKSRRTAIISAASAIALAGTLAAMAQQASQPTTNPNKNQNSATAPTNNNTNQTNDATRNNNTRTAAKSKPGLSKLDEKTTGATVRASKLIGTNLTNSNDESVGEIKDLVMDASTGKVRYVAVTYGGFLGLGSKLFAVPFEAFHVRQNTSATTPGDYMLTLDVTKDQMKGAQGFDNDRWPDFADTNFTQELDRRYNVDRSQTRR